jgi:hypothetical protein
MNVCIQIANKLGNLQKKSFGLVMASVGGDSSSSMLMSLVADN